MKHLLLLVSLLYAGHTQAADPFYQYVAIKTSYGTCIVKLYNKTPLHKTNFLKLVKAKTYDNNMFHRVIKDFMIQGGDPNANKEDNKMPLGSGDLGYKVPAEFVPELFHKKGVLAAARDNNPQKASSASQFYLVQGKVFTDAELIQVENKQLKYKIPAAQRAAYMRIGGTPHLDRNYTVFGEIVSGIEMVDKIAAVEKGMNDRPKEDVRLSMRILKKKEAKRLEKKLYINKLEGVF